MRPELITRPLIARMMMFCAVFWAALGTATAASTPVRIQQVDVDQQAGTLTILGTGFDNKTDTRIDLGTYTALDILSETATEIVAALPAGLEPGGYLLIATVTNGTSQTDEFDLMIDARPRLDVLSFDGDLGAPLVTQSPSLEDMPGMALDIEIPPGENRRALITFSAIAACTQTPLDTTILPDCVVQPNLNVSNLAIGFTQASGTGGHYASNSFQWVSDPLAPGVHTVQMRFAAYNYGGGPTPTFVIYQATLSVKTYPESDATAAVLYNGT